MLDMTFNNRNAAYNYLESCNDECMNRLQIKDASCTKKYVDCSLFGGYDDSDKCQQTCNEQESQG
jgi:hypothetical protein